MLNTTEILNAAILIVDDQKANVLLLEKMLNSAGYTRVTSTTNPCQVCELYQKNSYDLILLDLQMPEMDGFQVMEELKKIDREGYFPILVITAQPNTKLRALQSGAKDFISKPFDLVEIQTRIRNMLEVRLLYQKLSQHNALLEKTVLERTAELRASEARFKSFTELISDWYWEQDALGNFTTVSGPVFKMLGIDPQDDTDASFNKWNAVEREALGSHIAGRRPFLDFVYTLKKSNGEARHLRVSGEPMFDSASRFIGYRGIGVEIVGHSSSDIELRYFRKAMSVINVGVCLIQHRTMRIIDVNEEMCRMSGYSYAELNALTLPELNMGSIDKLRSTFNDLVANGSVPQQSEELWCKDNSACPVLVDFTSFSDDGNVIIVAILNRKVLLHI